jgi:CDP-glucose 4,6-dehydratase
MNFWQNKKVFITGHTGFKGAWLTQTLLLMGADITGFSLPAPTNPSLFEQLNLSKKIKHIKGDINNRKKVISAIEKARPDIVLHLAAQSLVRYSYKNPLETFDTNVIGTLNVLEGCRRTKSIKSAVIITTDKCYLNNDSGKFFVEDDSLGGKDPYSASKAAAEIVTYSYYQSFLKDNLPTASARAGNVIGGGDFSEDRLIPDVVRAIENKASVEIRNPKATRPWQFVLEPLSGYMLLAEKLYTQGHKYSGGWNFGPKPEDIKPVDEVLENLKRNLDFKIELDKSPQPVEAKLLALDINKAQSQLAWQPQLTLPSAIDLTGQWYKEYLSGGDMEKITTEQILNYFGL